MQTAPDFLWVFLALPLIAAMGLSAALLAQPERLPLRSDKAQQLALALAVGLSLNYALGVLLSELRWVLIAGTAIAAASLAWALARRPRALAGVFAMGWIRWLFSVALVLGAAGAILFEPLQGWDARSVWFFNARRIFFSDGLVAGDGWTNRAYVFSHADYPKLLPLLAAQFASAWDLWNEYIPKASLLVLLGPVVVAFMGLAQRIGLSLLFLAAALLLSTKEFLWNGYADTYLCLYAVVGMLYLARWLSTWAALDLACGAAFLGVAANLKNDGLLVVLCVAAGLIAWFCASAHARTAQRSARWPAGVWIAALLPCLGFIAWTLTKQQWQLASDMEIGAGSAVRAWQRLQEGRLALVAQSLVVQSGAGNAAALFLGAALLARILRTPVPTSAAFPALVATLYSAGMFLVYLATPHDVAWHLSTSAERTMLLPLFAYLGSTFLVLQAMELPGPARFAAIQQPGLNP